MSTPNTKEWAIVELKKNVKACQREIAYQQLRIEEYQRMIAYLESEDVIAVDSSDYDRSKRVPDERP